MKVEPTTQRDKLAGAPDVFDPVNVTMDVDVYYTGDGYPVKVKSPIYCARSFADTVLQCIEDWCATYSFRPCHLGVYNPRMARRVNGTLIVPHRWSNHAYGAAIDFAGVLTTDSPDDYMNIIDMLNDDNYRDIAQELIDNCEVAIEDAGRRIEIVNEGSGTWMHIGMRP